MRHQADAGFWDLYFQLAEPTRKRADKAFALLKQNSDHPSLHFKKVGAKWPARVDRNHRALAIETDDGLLWVWIGSHDAYIREIGK
jgi:hypothetical protein